MKKAKITHIQGNGTWNDLYKFDVTMDNDDTGTVFSKTQTPTFSVGEEKSYEITPSGAILNVWPTPISIATSFIA